MCIYPEYEEYGYRRPAMAVTRLIGDDSGQVAVVEAHEVRASGEIGSRLRTPESAEARAEWLPADLVLVHTGSGGVEDMPLTESLGLSRTKNGVLACGTDWQTPASGVFVCGDAHRGASLIVWAIAEGRSAASAVDVYLTGASDLPAPVLPTSLPLTPV